MRSRGQDLVDEFLWVKFPYIVNEVLWTRSCGQGFYEK